MHSPSRRTAPRLAAALVAALVLALSRPTLAEEPDARAPRDAPLGAPPAPPESQPLPAPARQVEAGRDATPAAPPERGGATTAAPPAPAAKAATSSFVLGGYAEAAYQWNFNVPSNGITHFRGFDNRHNTLTLSNVALDAAWDHEGLIGRLALQVGHTPSTYYLSEPVAPGASATSATGPEVWKYLQQANVGYRFGVGRGLTVTAGLFLSPIGPESMAVRDNWNWSRSNLFFGLPFYHTGVRASYSLSDPWVVTLGGYNGWNSVVDNNHEKSASAEITYKRDHIAVSLLYFGGIERPQGAREGRAWRHLLDSHVTWHASPRLSLLAHANGGLEPNELGVSGWAAGAIGGRLKLLEQLFFAVRGDVFYEHVPENGAGRATPIFWPAPWVSSGTATVDLRPHERVSFRLEYRHDHAGGDMYFGGHVEGDGGATPFVMNRDSQDTLTGGATTWF